jgi:chemotaxis protein methyltransferase CheR
MTPQDYDYLRKLLKERSGLLLAADKQYLVESRLLPIARKNGMTSLGDLVVALKIAPRGALATSVVEAMTTNESFFFRDKLPFDYFKTLMLPALMERRAREKRIRIWCNAASTGQEPYSLAMMLDSVGAALAGWRVDILATDISEAVLAKAREGIYTQFEVQRGLPIALLIKYFTQVGEQWQIAPDIRRMVSYRPFNLLDEFTRLGTFDIVYCRNVLIYFDRDTKINVLNRLVSSVARDGYLLLGAAETVVGLTNLFKPLTDHRGVYMPNPAMPATASPPLAPAGAYIAPAAERVR